MTGTDLQAWLFEDQGELDEVYWHVSEANTKGEMREPNAARKVFKRSEIWGNRWFENRNRRRSLNEVKGEAKGEALREPKSEPKRPSEGEAWIKTLMSEAKFTAKAKRQAKRSRYEVCAKPSKRSLHERQAILTLTWGRHPHGKPTMYVLEQVQTSKRSFTYNVMTFHTSVPTQGSQRWMFLNMKINAE